MENQKDVCSRRRGEARGRPLLRVGAQAGPPPPNPLTRPSQAAALYLIVQRAGQPHFTSGWGDSEESGKLANPIGQSVLVLVPSYQPEGHST